MKKLLSSILIFCTLILDGCNYQNSATSENYKINETTPIQEDDSWKYEVAQRLYDEFCYFYNNMEEHEIIQKAMNTHKYVNRNAVGYNCIMANDRGCGISQVYYKYLSDEQLEDVRNKMFDLDYVDYFSGVQFGYSENGLHFIAIYPLETEYGTAKREAINEIRNLNDEFSFMSEFTDCCPLDLYVEDLSGRTDYVSIKINFDNKSPINNISLSAVETLKKYGKNYILNNSLNLDSWNLYMFEKTSTEEISITVGDETVELFNGIPVKNLPL